jgi:hypothetical protein
VSKTPQVVGEARLKGGLLKENKSEPGLNFDMRLKARNIAGWNQEVGVWLVMYMKTNGFLK